MVSKLRELPKLLVVNSKTESFANSSFRFFHTAVHFVQFLCFLIGMVFVEV
jgi:hypothetical protein